MRAETDMDILIGKFLSGEATPEEAMELEDWKAAHPDNLALFEDTARALGWVDHLAQVDSAWMNVHKKITSEAPVRKLHTTLIWRVAAAVVLLVSVGAGYWFFNSGNQEVLAYAAGNQQRKINLNDGTGISIASHSSVEMQPGFGKTHRKVKLKGSGYFTVTHSEELPFVIETGPIHIKDLGTQFDVHSTKDTIYVRVDEGEVLIYDENGLKIKLKAKESAYYVISTGKLEMEVRMPGVEGTDKTYLFHEQPLSKVVEKINELYSQEVLIDDPAAATCLITIEIGKDDLDELLEVIADTLGLSLEKHGNEYWLKGKGTCS
jgi:ferric-dicitrate binding protein FerR (iron transport regulator)